MKIINKIQDANLTGRGGADFPTAFKWLAVLKAKAENFDRPTYVICNATEGEPGVTKDKYIIQKYPKELIEGIKIAIDTVSAEKAIIYCQSKDLKKFKARLLPFIKKNKIEFFAEDGGYLCGEETTLLETIEKKRSEPRLKPPYPTEKGLYDCPTIVNNVETFYYIAKISKNDYHWTRFYSIGGEVKNPGVFELPIKMTVFDVLKKTKNIPRFKYFAQIGGAAAGKIFLSDELNHELKGTGAITIYNLKKTDPKKLMIKWIDFFYKSNCGKCVPCREGLYRVREQLRKKQPDWLMMRAILETMREASFCPLGKSVYDPMVSLMQKIDIK